MKKFSKLIALSLVFVISAAAFTGCSGKNNEDPPADPTPTPEILQEIEKDVTVYDDKVFDAATAEKFNGELPEEIEFDGHIYRLQYDTIDYSEEGIKKVLQQIVELKDVTQADIDKIANQGEFDFGGKKYVLTKDFVEKEVVTGTYTFNEEVVYENQKSGAPKFPKTKEMSYVSPITNQTVKVEGKLVDSEIIDRGDWVDFKVDVKFAAPTTDAPNYVLHGTEFTIPYNASAPTWTGYQKDLIKLLGLSDDNYKITSAKWDGDFAKENDMVVRHGTYYGSQREVTYKAIYEAPAEKLVTNVKVYYRTEITEGMELPEEDITTVYGIKLTAKYVLVK